MPLRTRLIHEIGTQAFLRVYWGEKECPSCLGKGAPGYHDAERAIAMSEKLGDWALGGDVGDYPEHLWPVYCDHCGAHAPRGAEGRIYTASGSNGGLVRCIHHHRVYDSPSGEPEPGDIFEQPWYHEHFCEWTNCDGRHLVCVLPDGHEWHMMGRASNCTMKEDRTHRCWVVREESPGVFHVDKDGHTCAAGAGSIQSPGFHGYLHHGILVNA